ncbi:MAG: hypothetical protein ACK4IT_08410 [Thioalkalivibrionaceae bacterium]
MADNDRTNRPHNLVPHQPRPNTSGAAEPMWGDAERWGWPQRSAGVRLKIDGKRLDEALLSALADDRFLRLSLVQDELARLLEAERLDSSPNDHIRFVTAALAVLDQALSNLRQVHPPLGPLHQQRLETALSILDFLALLELRIGLNKQNDQPSIEARVRALAWWGEHSLLLWSFYRSTRPDFWRKSAVLISSLTADDALDRKIPLTPPRYGVNELSAAMILTGLAVVTVSQPIALPRGAAISLFEWTLTTPPAVENGLTRPMPNGRLVVGFDMSSADAPMIATDTRLPMRRGIWFSLDTLVQRLREDADAVTIEPARHDAKTSSSLHLRDHLIRIWTHKPTRRHSRVAVDAEITALTGIPAIHERLTQEATARRKAADQYAHHEAATQAADDDEQIASSQAVSAAAPVRSPPGPEEPDDSPATPRSARQQHPQDASSQSVGPKATERGAVQVFVLPEDNTVPNWRLDGQPAIEDGPKPLGARDFGTAESAWLAAERGLDSPSTGSSSSTNPDTTYRWILRNRSAGGLRLQIRQAPVGALLVGELIALRGEARATPRTDAASSPARTPAQPPWQIGVLRWIKEDESGVLEGGFERLAINPLPGDAFVMRNRRAYGEVIPTLMISDDRGNTGAMLLLPAHQLANESMIVLRIAGVSRIVHLNPATIAVSALFQMRSFRVSDDKLLANPDESNTTRYEQADEWKIL